MASPPFLTSQQKDSNDIFGHVVPSRLQDSELKLREKVAGHIYIDYLQEVSKHHSIEVMDREIKLFLNKIPTNGVICDIGGGWGWHWRNLYQFRPDVNVVIVDFCKSNLYHAKNLLKDQINKTIWLVHGDATQSDVLVRYRPSPIVSFWEVIC